MMASERGDDGKEDFGRGGLNIGAGSFNTERVL
jgi:hypothetical protein